MFVGSAVVVAVAVEVVVDGVADDKDPVVIALFALDDSKFELD